MNEHTPQRGSEVEAWLKNRRDARAGHRDWAVLDSLLDEYRLRADTGLTLADDLSLSGEE